MSRIMPVGIIPQPEHVHETFKLLKEIVVNLHPQDLRRRAQVFHSVVVEIARTQLDRLREVLPFVDFISVPTLEPTPLDRECRSVAFHECGGKIYSPTATLHPGAMSGSGKSDASYALTVHRKVGGRPVTLLLQHLRAGGKTSLHYHQEITETFVSLLGEAFIYVRDQLRWSEGVIRKLARFEPARVPPGTTHQLMTGVLSAVNVLCMDNFDPAGDPDLKDHHYEVAGADYRKVLATVGLA